MKTFLATVFAFSIWTSLVQAIYFYIDGEKPKCFYEDLPKDTLVVGSYKGESYNAQLHEFHPNPELTIQITVDETFDNDHRVITHTTTSADRMSKFTFSAARSGLHRICFWPSGAGALSVNGWFSGAGSTFGGVRMVFDLAIGETSKIESEDKGKIDSIVSKVRELNSRLQDVKREQMFQREREAEFRDQSEATNAKIVRWTLVQLGVLGVTCAWQLSHLRSFFIKQKLT